MDHMLGTETIEVSLDKVCEVGSLRDGGEDPEHVRLLAEIFDSLPPILVHAETMQLIDGVHRLRAAKLRGCKKIRAKVFKGTESEAFVFAVWTNVSHGLPLSLEERKAACLRIIDIHPDWADRRISRVAGISPKTVGNLRRAKGGDPGSRVGQDGRVRPVNSSVGRQRAAELIQANPEQSLRQVARASGVSPETVRDVRRRLLFNEAPVPVGAADERQADALKESQGQHNWRRAMRTLRSDPAMRYSEHGRLLLRILSLHDVEDEEWQKILHAVPEYARPMLGQAAQGCVSLWTSTVRRIENDEEDVKSA
ncbi:ParB/RepB/Spo0J family partition protein [Streptomonospora salina]|uniref:ParB-like chromosome segregation protein Spo0J n=1 Tax=Streptomonospora salina TaxID=104205 RepID=A0A841EC71_9ACTN|nr:ParB N-terminal domain-containing protein [Streptomonospora salina]MBB6000014.1 ParB-like chromosome segregation protein Spo0J [Streptomonospora salina]